MSQLEKIEYVPEDKWPRDIREALNILIDRDRRKWEVRFTEDKSPQSARVEMSDDRVVILIPRSLGGGSGRLPFRCIKRSNTQIRVILSFIEGVLPTGFNPDDDPPFILTVSGNGIVYGKITYSASTGAISERVISAGATIPDNDATHTYCAIASYATDEDGLGVTNGAYGPLTSVACRDWFAEGTPFSRSLIAANAYF